MAATITLFGLGSSQQIAVADEVPAVLVIGADVDVSRVAGIAAPER